jgi:hypothetical protein
VGHREVGVEFDRPLHLRDCRVVLPREEQTRAVLTVEDERERINLQRPPYLGQRFLVSAETHEQLAVPVMRGRVIRIQFDGALVLAFRPGEIVVVVDDDVTVRGVRFRQVVVERQGFPRGFSRLRHNFMRRASRIRQQRVGVGQPGIGQRVSGVERDGLLEVFD